MPRAAPKQPTTLARKSEADPGGLPAHVDQDKLKDALAIIENIGKLRGNADPNAPLAPEDMALIGQAMEQAGMTPQEFFGMSAATRAAAAAPKPALASPRKAQRQQQQQQLQLQKQMQRQQQQQPQKPQHIKYLHKDEAKAVAFFRTLEEKLKPALNDYDEKEAAQVQLDLLTEKVRGTQRQRTTVAGAATDASRRSMRLRSAQIRRVTVALMRTHGHDAKLLDRRMRESDGNWLEALHRKLYDSIPPAFSRLYRTLDEASMRRTPALAAEAELVDRHTPGERSFMPNRERGLIASVMGDFGVQLLLHPLTLGVSFAIPNEEALQAIAQHAPLVEVGAGTGYWSAVLQKVKGVDILAFDAAPPMADHANNGFFSTQFTEVSQSDSAALFESNPALARSRAMLIIWPNNPEAEGEANQPKVWDTRCLQAYLEAGGRTVIYVGERMEGIQVVGGERGQRGQQTSDSGISSSRPFQKMLIERFDLAKRVVLPTWKPYHADDLTVWTLKEAQPVAATEGVVETPPPVVEKLVAAAAKPTEVLPLVAPPLAVQTPVPPPPPPQERVQEERQPPSREHPVREQQQQQQQARGTREEEEGRRLAAPAGAKVSSCYVARAAQSRCSYRHRSSIGVDPHARLSQPWKPEAIVQRVR